MSAVFLDRIRIWKETQAASRHIAAQVPPTVKVWWSETKECIASYSDPAILRVLDADCLDVVRALPEGRRPVVLNLSDDYAAGGAVELGSGAQEESLWRRTALCVTQKQELYPLCASPEPVQDPSLLYSPDVPVLRDTEARGYAWFPVDMHMRVSFIACPAIKHPNLVYLEGGEKDLKETDKLTLAHRLRLILRVAAMKGHDTVIVGPMGCGAWKNPPKAVARVFATVLRESEFTGAFREIIVAALTTNPRIQNAEVFSRELGV